MVMADKGSKLPVKKLVIKPLRSRSTLPQDFQESNWACLREAIYAIQNETSISASLEELYRRVEDLCVQGNAEWLYGQLQQECEGHAVRVLGSLAAVSQQDERFLELIEEKWNTYCSQLILIRHIFLYLDRTHLLVQSEHRSLFDMGLFYFREHMDKEYVQVKERIIEQMMKQIDAEREAYTIRRDLLKSLVRMFTLLGLYDISFIPIFLSRTNTFYSDEASKNIQTLTLSQYLEYVDARIAEEFDRCNFMLATTSRIPLIQTVEACIIEPHIGRMLEHGFDKLIDEDHIEDLKRMYRVFGRVKAHKALCLAFKNHLKTVGSAIVNNQEKDSEMIKNIITLKQRMDRILAECFEDIMYQDAMKDAFGYFVNMKSNRPAELLAKHMDSILRGGGKIGGSGSKGGQAAEDDVESALDSCLSIFRFISGKDAFEAFYKKDLAKRLLFNRSFSVDIEKSAISKLKTECGAHFTSKLEGMFKDVELSKDIMASFKASPSAMEQLSIVCPGTDINVQVLTSGLWPTYQQMECNFPESLFNGLETFRKHYLEKHNGRKLMWLHPLGTCIMKVTFSSGTKELALSFFQAATLMCFENTDSLRFKEIASSTGIEDGELRRTLQSLACGREKVLLKEPRGKDVNDDDTFIFNTKYTSKQYRVKINAIQMKETSDESRKTNEMVMQDRQHQIDAAIVRVMKTRKTLGHKLLMNELMTQLRFPVSATDLKKRVESLIDREYIERDPSDAQIYNYLA